MNERSLERDVRRGENDAAPAAAERRDSPEVAGRTVRMERLEDVRHVFFRLTFAGGVEFAEHTVTQKSY